MITLQMSRPTKPMNTKELAAAYGVGYETFISWLKPIRQKVGEQLGKMWTVKQIQIIFDHLGNPGND